MAKKARKKSQVEKVSAETGVEVKDLERLPQEALAKLDALVPDLDDDLLGGDHAELPSPVDSELGTLSTSSTEEVAVSSVDVESVAIPSPELPKEPKTPEVAPSEGHVHDGEKTLLGFHPVSGEPVYQ